MRSDKTCARLLTRNRHFDFVNQITTIILGTVSNEHHLAASVQSDQTGNFDGIRSATKTPRHKDYSEIYLLHIISSCLSALVAKLLTLMKFHIRIFSGSV